MVGSSEGILDNLHVHGRSPLDEVGRAGLAPAGPRVRGRLPPSRARARIFLHRPPAGSWRHWPAFVIFPHVCRLSFNSMTVPLTLTITSSNRVRCRSGGATSLGRDSPGRQTKSPCPILGKCGRTGTWASSDDPRG